MTMATETTLKTVERALRVMEIVAAHPSPPQVREVAKALGHNITSTYHLVNTLIASGYLAKGGTGRLSIGRQIGVLHASYLRRSDFSETVRPLISFLADASEETIYLTRFVADASVIEMVVESTRSLRVTGLHLGYSGLEDRRASGKAVLAQLAPDQLDAAFARLHPELSPTKRSAALAELSNELAAIREQGYAFDDEAFEEGVCCVAAPYFGARGRVAGAIAASCPALRRERLLTEVRPQVIATAHRVTELASLLG
jgi:DNA-binding IclR family transcriptional regulator